MTLKTKCGESAPPGGKKKPKKPKKKKGKGGGTGDQEGEAEGEGQGTGGEEEEGVDPLLVFDNYQGLGLTLQE